MNNSYQGNDSLLFFSQSGSNGLTGVCDRGITLVELLIVIAIIGILVVALSFSYQGWMGRFTVEKQTKDIYTDLMTARLRAIERNRVHFAQFLTATTYRIVEDTTENGGVVPGDGDTIIVPPPSAPLPSINAKSVEYDMHANDGGVPVTFVFGKRGLISPSPRSLWFTHTSDSDYDCLVFAETRIIIGRMVGGACVAK